MKPILLEKYELIRLNNIEVKTIIDTINIIIKY